MRRNFDFLALVVLLITGMIVLGVNACASNPAEKETFEGTTYKVLTTAAITYETSMSALSDLKKSGSLKQSTEKKAREIGVKFWGAYHTAADLFASYLKVGSAEKKQRIEAAIVEMLAALSTFTKYVAPLIAD